MCEFFGCFFFFACVSVEKSEMCLDITIIHRSHFFMLCFLRILFFLVCSIQTFDKTAKNSPQSLFAHLPNRIKGCLILLHPYWFFAIALRTQHKYEKREKKKNALLEAVLISFWLRLIVMLVSVCYVMEFHLKFKQFLKNAHRHFIFRSFVRWFDSFFLHMPFLIHAALMFKTSATQNLIYDKKKKFHHIWYNLKELCVYIFFFEFHRFLSCSLCAIFSTFFISFIALRWFFFLAAHNDGKYRKILNKIIHLLL